MLYKDQIKITSSAIDVTTESFQVLTDLAKNYFVAGEIASFPGRIVGIVSPFLKEVVDEFGEDIYDKMISSDPVIEQCVGILFKSISTFTTRPVSSGNTMLHKFCTAYVREIFARMENFEEEEVRMNYDFIRYGASYGSLVYEAAEIFGLPALSLESIKTISPKDILEVKSATGETIGFVPTGQIFKRIFGTGTILIDYLMALSVGDYQSFEGFSESKINLSQEVNFESTQFVPRSRVFRQLYIPTSDFADGNRGVLDSVIHFWWLRQQVLAIITFFSQNFSLPKEKGTLPQGVSVVTAKNPDGSDCMNGDSVIRIEAKEDYLNTLTEAANGGRLVTAADYMLEYVAADPAILDKLWALFVGIGKEIKAGILLQTASTSENASGTSSDSQKPLLNLNTHYLKQRKKSAFKRLYKHIIKLTYPNLTKYAPDAFCGNVNGLPYDLTEVALFAQSDYFDKEEKKAINRLLNFPIGSDYDI